MAKAAGIGDALAEATLCSFVRKASPMLGRDKGWEGRRASAA